MDRTVTLASVELRITEAGVGGRPLLLVHGLGGSRTDFDLHLEAFADAGWHAVAPDLRGHGESGHPGDVSDYSLEIFAADLRSLTDALGWEHYALVGHSMGGMVSQVLALDDATPLQALVLMDTGPGPVAIDRELIALGVQIALEQGMDVVADVMATIEAPLTTEAYLRLCEEDPAYAARSDRHLRGLAAPMYAAMLQVMIDQPSRLDALASLSLPVLVVVGDQDEEFLEASRQMAAVIPGARLSILPDGGHSPQFEAAEAWWEAVSTFLAEAVDPAPAATTP